MTTLALSKYGGRCKIVIDTSTFYRYLNLTDIELDYNSTDSTITFTMKNTNGITAVYTPLPIASVTIGGVVITDQTVFETQLALVFPSAGGTALTTDSVAEINAGTDNVKYVTALGLEGSKYLTQAGAKISAVASGTDTYTATLSPAITAYTVGQRFFITFTNANTGAATLNFNGLGALALKKNGTTALGPNDLPAGGIACVAYDGTNIQVLGLNNTLLRGITGGQTIYGGIAANDPLTIEGTSHGTKTTSYVNLQPTSGNVGIGTTTPSATLDVNGSGRFSNSVTILTNKSLSLRDAGVQFYSPATNQLSIYTNGNDNVRVDASGRVGIGLTTLTAMLHIKAGTATASTAPIKLTAGTRLTTPEAGVLETNSGNELFYSTSTSSNSRGYVGMDKYVAKTGAYTATADDGTIDCTSGTFTVTLPASSGLTGRPYVIKNSGAGTITIDGNASETIDGATTKVLNTQYAGVKIQSDGTNWIIIGVF